MLSDDNVRPKGDPTCTCDCHRVSGCFHIVDCCRTPPHSIPLPAPYSPLAVGPWEVRHWDGEEWPQKRISVSGGDRAILISPAFPSDTTLHDATLAAAAPDLFQALYRLAEDVERFKRGELTLTDLTTDDAHEALNKSVVRSK